jgi:hypothetical protein
LGSWRRQPFGGEVERNVNEHVLLTAHHAQFKIGAVSLLHDEDVVPALAGVGISDN